MKICTKCKIGKEEAEFPLKKRGQSALRSRCKSCRKEDESYRYHNDPNRKAQHDEQHYKVVARNKNIIENILKESQCLDCGLKDVRVLEFDHVRGEKRINIAQMRYTGYSIQSIHEEVAKCEIVCANCHKIRTYSRLDNCWRNE